MRKLIVGIAVSSLVCLMAGSVLAQGLGFNGIGGRLGYVKPDNVDGTIGLAVHADLGEIIESLVFMPSISYFKKSYDVTSPLGGTTVEASFSQVGLNADARYYFPTSGNLSFFAGGGLAMLFSEAETNVSGFGGGSVSNTDIGLDLLGGLDLPISDNLNFTAEGRFVVSDGNVFKVEAGVTYVLGGQ